MWCMYMPNIFEEISSTNMCGRARLDFAIIRASIQFVFEGLTGEVEFTGEVDLGSMMGHRSTLS